VEETKEKKELMMQTMTDVVSDSSSTSSELSQNETSEPKEKK